MELLRRFGEAIGRVNVWVVAVLAFGVSMLADGVSRSPAFDRYLAIAQSPGADPGITGSGSFVLGSPAGSLAAAVVGATTPQSFEAMSLFLVALSFGGAIWVTKRKHGSRAGQVVALMWAALPISTVLLTWLGQPDPFIFATGTALAVTVSPVAALVWGIVGGFASSLQAAIIVVAVAVAARRSWRWAALASAGVVIGRGAVLAWQHFAGITQEVDRIEYLLSIDPSRFIAGLTNNWVLLLWSLLAGAWPIVVWLVWKKRMWRTAASLTAMAGIMLVTLDTTRVFALLSWPVLFLAAPHIDEDAAVGWLALAAILIPAVVIWDGRLYVYVFGGA